MMNQHNESYHPNILQHTLQLGYFDTIILSVVTVDEKDGALAQRRWHSRFLKGRIFMKRPPLLAKSELLFIATQFNLKEHNPSNKHLTQLQLEHIHSTVADAHAHP